MNLEAYSIGYALGWLLAANQSHTHTHIHTELQQFSEVRWTFVVGLLEARRKSADEAVHLLNTNVEMSKTIKKIIYVRI